MRPGRTPPGSRHPSPGDRAVLAFTLAKSGPTRLEVFDVAGRRVVERDVSGLGPGRHQLPIGRLEAGVYLIRMSTDRGFRVARGVVVR